MVTQRPRIDGHRCEREIAVRLEVVGGVFEAMDFATLDSREPHATGVAATAPHRTSRLKVLFRACAQCGVVPAK